MRAAQSTTAKEEDFAALEPACKNSVEIGASATVTLKNGANPVPRPSRARMRLALTESEARKIGRLSDWQSAKCANEQRRARKIAAVAEMQNLVALLVAHGASQCPRWSQHVMEKKTGIPRRTFARLKTANTNPALYLPRLRAAVERIGVTIDLTK